MQEIVIFLTICDDMKTLREEILVFFVTLMKLVVIFLTIWGFSLYYAMISKRRILDL